MTVYSLMVLHPMKWNISFPSLSLNLTVPSGMTPIIVFKISKQRYCELKDDFCICQRHITSNNNISIIIIKQNTPCPWVLLMAGQRLVFGLWQKIQLVAQHCGV
mmetsp:Transcript_40116/g.43552  ORF Transcript_40116/g.43552 Transcript_40116/m.43552 type:complete len:104 (-) Transcript_40116:386-697(-)